MKAFPLKRHGPPSVLKMVDMPDPDPGAGRVCVKLHTIGINYAEILSRKGLYGWAPKLPYIPGMEGYGEIVAVGPDVDRGRIGERVIVGTKYGCYAEKVVVPARNVLPAISDFSPEENAAFGVNYMTAWVSLFEMARLRREDAVLVCPAAGGVGTAAVQIAKHFGCRVYGLAGNDEKVALLQQLGVDAAINYRKADFVQALRAEPQFPGIDVAVEMVGGAVYRKCFEVLNPCGRVVVAGFASLALQKWNPVSWWKTWRDLPKARIQKLAERSHGVLSTHLGFLLAEHERMQKVWADLVAFIQAKKIRPHVGRIFDFAALPEAHAFIESRRSTGKIVIQVMPE